MTIVGADGVIHPVGPSCACSHGDPPSDVLTSNAWLTGLMGKTDAEQLKTEALVIQATEFREKSLFPVVIETDPEKTVSSPVVIPHGR